MKKRRLLTVLFALYSTLMLLLLFVRTGIHHELSYRDQLLANLNLVPLRTLRLFARLLRSPHPHFVRSAVVNLLGNVVMFIPLGCFLPLLWKKLRRLSSTLWVAAIIVTCIELTQLFTLLGSCDIDDLILNLIGAALGYGLFRFIPAQELP